MPDLKIGQNLANDAFSAICNIKMSDFADKTVGDFLITLRAGLGLVPAKPLQDSIEEEQKNKIEELKAKIIELENKK